LQLVASS